MNIAFAFYSAGVALVVWAALVPFELLRMALGLSTVDDLMEHLGGRDVPPKRRGVRLLLHGVSVGETAAAIALMDEIRRQIAGCGVVLTTGSREGRKAADRYKAQFPEIEVCSFLPWDRATAIRKWLERLDADAVVIMETEIWPNLYQSCRDLGLPLFIVSGRLYPGDVGRYRLARRFFREVLAAVRWIGVQGPSERDAFVRIGAAPDRIEIVGNIKFDAPRTRNPLPDGWRIALEQSRPLIVAGSTHAPEERLLLEAFRRLRPQFPLLRVVVTPRHPRRAGRVRRLAERHGFRVAVWSMPRSSELEWDVLIVDRIGWLSELYRYADVAFVGGTLSRRGGHNILEAAAHARPAIVGHHIAHIRDLVGELEREGAILRVRPEGPGGPGSPGSHDLTMALNRLLADEPGRVEMGRRAKQFYDGRRGVARTCVGAMAQRAILGPAYHPLDGSR